LDVEKIIEILGLEPHPEGGYYAETYRATEPIPWPALPDRYDGERCHGTGIYYLLTATSFSALHRIRSDELFHFYLGDPVTLLRLHPDGGGDEHVLGPELQRGQRPQAVAPRGVWQGLRLEDGGRFALLGCTVAPGFDFADFELGEREQLIQEYPRWLPQIRQLTR